MTLTRDQQRNIAALATFITNAPATADRFKVSTRSAMGPEVLMSMSAAELVEKVDATEAATHVILQCDNWADNGAGGEASFNAQYVDGDDHELTTHRFRTGNAREAIQFDGSGESILAQMQDEKKVLLEHNLRAQKVLMEGYEALTKAQNSRLEWLEGRQAILEAEKIVLQEQKAEDEDGDEQFDKLISAGVEIVKQGREHEVKLKAAAANGKATKTRPKTKNPADEDKKPQVTLT